MSKHKHPVADAFAHLAAMMHECDVESMPTLVFANKVDHSRVMMALQREVGGDPMHEGVIATAPTFYGVGIEYSDMVAGQFKRRMRD